MVDLKKHKHLNSVNLNNPILVFPDIEITGTTEYSLKTSTFESILSELETKSRLEDLDAAFCYAGMNEEGTTTYTFAQLTLDEAQKLLLNLDSLPPSLYTKILRWEEEGAKEIHMRFEYSPKWEEEGE